ncbi:MAG TPA: hypothetical protein VIG57_11515 [Candidatus Entotheonella sp.]|jgi:hypothetical protein
MATWLEQGCEDGEPGLEAAWSWPNAGFPFVEVDDGLFDLLRLYGVRHAHFGIRHGKRQSTEYVRGSGTTWERIDHGISPQSTTFGVAINRQNPEQICFCTRKGQVFSTPDNGASWREHVLPDAAMNVISVACASV